MRGEALECRPPTVSSFNVAVGAGQQQLDELPYVRLVVHDENAGHGRGCYHDRR